MAKKQSQAKKKINIMELVSILRSKNAGPVYFGLDLIFKDQKGYALGKKYITKEMIAGLYNIPVEEVVVFVAYDPGMGIKATIRRPTISSDPGDTDILGAQQHVPLMSIDLPEE